MSRALKSFIKKTLKRENLNEKCDVITDDDNEKSDVPEDVGEKLDVITKEKDTEKCDVPDEVRKSDVGEKHDVITKEKMLKNVMYQMMSEIVMLARNVIEKILKREYLMRR